MIIDASVVFKWLVVEPDSQAAIDWIGRSSLTAPNLILVEVANALWKRTLRGELLGEGGAEQLAGLPNLVRIIEETAFVPDALELAIELSHPIYDCIYLATAHALDEELLTADGKFIRALEGTRHRDRVRAL